MHTLAESSAAIVFSERARLELDTAIGYLPANSNILQPANIHVIPHGAHTLPSLPDKEQKKAKLGLKGKTVLITIGYQGPDKVSRKMLINDVHVVLLTECCSCRGLTMQCELWHSYQTQPDKT
jgi:hypothetical protein